jgi:hypothetical protein
MSRSALAPSGSPADVPKRKSGKHVLQGLVLVLLILLPWQSSIEAATSAVPPRGAGSDPVATRIARQATKVASQTTISLASARVTTRERARVTVTVTRSDSQSGVSGRVRVVARGGGRSRTVRVSMAGRQVAVKLPALPVGIYRVRATFLGSGTVSPSTSPVRWLTVIEPRDSLPSRFPNAASTGVPDAVALTPYSGPCTITRNRTVIEAKSVSCSLVVQARHVVIKNSSLQTVWLDQDVMHARHEKGWSMRVVNSEVDAGTADGPGVCCGNYRLIRVAMKGGHNGAQCENGASYCELVDSWIHSQYEPIGGLRHLGGFLNDGGTPTTLVHNRITCDAPAQNSEGGCTGDVNLIPNFGVMSGVLVQGNYLGANANSAYCTYAGSEGGSYSTRANHIVYLDNVFGKYDTISDPASGQPGSTRRCAAYGPVVGYDAHARGNAWSGNRYVTGTLIRCDARHSCR